MTTIPADELQPGDVVVYEGHRHEIAHIDRHAGWSWPIATGRDGWAIALSHRSIAVLRPAA